MNASSSNEESVQRLVVFFETLTVDSVKAIPDFYAPEARFKDPFNDVTGQAAIAHIFADMFKTLEVPRFVVQERIVQGQQCFLTWEFRFRFRRFKQGQEQVILGGSHLVLDDAGRVTLHRDYWDAAEELYEKLPLVGALMRWLKKRANS
ncbi:nuclear transport factor 2 family protein [Rhodoferax saidenbachensis]|uniref:Isomerase n=1 Tax=Rhodoferax saidenbachensis TaxID=1484693 RepID=A0A1P8KEK3_9BURK|nr:nuclear transport factor 2 family protein [Rhodoferax saidenbachensis]APW44467.1 isomerase [Rhodoferax saidenbachensis]